HEEAGRNPHGKGQGVARDVGRGREARSHALRDGGCRPPVCMERAQAGGGEAVAADAGARASHGRRGRTMKLRDLKDLSLDELKHRGRELTDEVFHLRLKRASSQLPNPMKMRESRRALARVKTLLRERAAGGPV